MTDVDDRVCSERPPCPKCQSFKTRSRGGASLKKYYYTCKVCKADWMQFPPHSSHVKEGGDVEISFKKFKQSAKTYACSRCGANPKKGHSCPYKAQTIEAASSLLQLPMPSSSPPLPLPPLHSAIVGVTTGQNMIVHSDSNRSLEPS